MSYLEELLPEFRKGAKIRLANWKKGKFIVLKEDAIVDNANYEYPLSIYETLSNCWELYQYPIDWDFIIKNKCLCWFWGEDENCKYLGTIRFINKDDELPFVNWERGYAKHCRPVRRDEVTFYEDRKDVE